MVHVLSLNIITTSQARKLWKRLKSYVEREPYSVNVKFTNLANMPFPGGNLTLLVAWPNGQAVTIDCSIPPLKPNESRIVKLGKTEALARGYGLFFCKKWEANDGKSIRLFDAQGRLIDSKAAIYSIPVKTWEEIYSFWALVVAVLSLAIVAIETIVKVVVILFGLQ